ncbi:ABC transporter G family member 11-like isoform X2 [Punica granatum]|uniref:ABC transporter G family member 11-like isoform X2 n=1 Tax=Punica granatum TaxID=22663 RepID=A0A6P8C9M6_PUNGR|nr:ABC transporter G family member 11-like isoform X2 [Punica granatum]
MSSLEEKNISSGADKDQNVEAGSARGPREGLEGRSVFISWEDLWVKVPDKKSKSRSILRGLTGYAKPGQVLAIMGPSGSGKSTLLDALAGRLDSKARQTGQILVNGRKQPLAYGTSAYVTQEDVLTWTLTVREAVYCSAELQLPDSIPLSEKRERAEATIKEMGLHDAMDTRIGGWGTKGLSNGQKRRVSICMEILTRPRLLLLDEPTSGLDSAASYYVMKRIVDLAKHNNMVVIASVHQPNSDVFGLFEDLCLLSLGSMVYFGPSSEAREFFSGNGFPCPSHQNPLDHYLRTINTDFDEDIDSRFGGQFCSTEEVITVLIRSYKSSVSYTEVRRQISEIKRRGGDPLEKGNQAGFYTQCGIIMRRSFVNMCRDPGYYWLRLVIYIALGLGLGTVFYDIGSDYSSIQARGSMLMFVASFLTILAIGGFPSFVEDMKVFERERLNGHYGSAAFVLGNTLSSMPFLLVISLIPSAITYFLVGLQQNIGHFMYFALTLFACMMLVESLMMIVASLMPNFLMALITGAGIQGLMILSGGFFRLPNDLPRILWRNIPSTRQGYSSEEEILRDVWQVEMGYSKWTNLGILFGMVVIYRVIFIGVLQLKEKFKPVIQEIMSISHHRAERSPINPYSRLLQGSDSSGVQDFITKADRRVLASEI